MKLRAATFVCIRAGRYRNAAHLIVVVGLGLFCTMCIADSVSAQNRIAATHTASLSQIKSEGARRSRLNTQTVNIAPPPPAARVEQFHQEIQPLLKSNCVSCHGTEQQEGDFRIDTLDPDLVDGDDVDWWIDVVDAVTNGEMPPEDGKSMSDADRVKIVDWLSNEIQIASQIRRSDLGRSSFRRMTRYEYNYALQDLLGLPYDFAADLPPETPSEDGFTNSAEVLQMSAMQFGYYRELARAALMQATVRGDQPAPLHWGITMEMASANYWRSQDNRLAKINKDFQDRPEVRQRALEQHALAFAVRPSVTQFKRLDTDQSVKAQWRYNGAKFAIGPTEPEAEIPAKLSHVALIPAKQRLVIELGDHIPDAGILRVRVRAGRTPDSGDRGSTQVERLPSLQLRFGHQASNNSSAEEVVGSVEHQVRATWDAPQFYQWDIPLSEITRNPLRGSATLGETPNPSEYLKLCNTSTSPSGIQVDYVQVIAPAHDQWPPPSHRRIFFDDNRQVGSPESEQQYARDIFSRWMSGSWRRPVSVQEIDRKVALFAKIRPQCDDFQQAVIEVLSTVLSSPSFLYLANEPVGGTLLSEKGDAFQSQSDADELRRQFQLATRLSMFLWCSIPDQELLDLASTRQLNDRDVLLSQMQRMRQDPRSKRFSDHFVRGWLGLQLLEYLKVDKKTYPRFDDSLKVAMQTEPVAFFDEVLHHNHSVMDFLHADYAIVNERLARHYGIKDVYGNHFRRVSLTADDQRGGLLTQAGLLAMNSDGKDSHPLKRGIWMLENLLNDPPPPPPPAVPEIDLTDPAIAKMTLKQRMEDHRSDPACMSCHAKIDPWGVAFENFDAIGSWRTKVNGVSVDATSVLFNQQKLNGMDGLKRFLLANRQDQFARALVHKMTTFALGRPLTFSDRSEIDRITAELRASGDGLLDLVRLIVTSDLFVTRMTTQAND